MGLGGFTKQCSSVSAARNSVGSGGFEPPEGEAFRARAYGADADLGDCSQPGTHCVQTEQHVRPRIKYIGLARSVSMFGPTDYRPLVYGGVVSVVPGLRNNTMYDQQITPETAVEEFIESKSYESSDSTIQNLTYRLKQFRLWCDQNNIRDLRELSSRDAEKFKVARANAGLSPVTMRCQIRTFKQFLRWAGNVGYCKPDLHERIIVPTPKREDRSREELISYRRGQRILSYLRKYEFASRRHLIFGILWHTGMRMGSLRSLDIGDVSHDDGGAMYLEIQHRPDTDTPLKLQKQGERHVTIADPELAEAIEGWLEHQRPDVKDEHGRQPLITTKRGRASHSTIRCDVYRATHPCLIDGECPHGNDRETCRYVARDFAGGCPSTVSPHPIRRSAITYHLDQDIPKEIVADRVAVSTDVLEEHYDGRDQEQSRTTRAKYVNDLRF